MCCSVLQCVAVCCSMLQCVAVCRSVLQCVVCVNKYDPDELCMYEYGDIGLHEHDDISLYEYDIFYRNCKKKELFELYVSFAEYCLFYRALLQKRPIILRSLLIVATTYRREFVSGPLYMCDMMHSDV